MLNLVRLFLFLNFDLSIFIHNGLNHFRLPFYSIFIYVVIVKATPIKQRKINPNDVKYYVSKKALKELESSIKIDTDLSKVTFFLWTPELGIDQPWEFKAGIEPQELINRHFDPERPTKFISHGWTDNGNHAKPFAEGT